MLKGGVFTDRITSLKNAKTEELRRLIGKTSERREKGLSVAEGVKLSGELLRENIVPEAVFVTEKCLSCIGNGLISSAKEAYIITDEIAKKVSDMKTPEGVFCVFKRKIKSETEIKPGKYIILDRLQDIGNAGTIIRTADAFGISGVIISPDSCDVFSPKGLRTSMGSVLRVNIFEMDAAFAVSMLNGLGAETYASVLSADERDLLPNIGFPEFSAVVIGNEGGGISDAALSVCKRKLTVPMSGKAESLNAAVASAIIMYGMSL